MLSLFLAILSLPASTEALTTPTPAPAATPLGGNAVPGLCMLSRPAIFGNAKVGVAATQRLQQLAQAAKAEVDAQRTAIETDEKALQADKVRLSPADLKQRQDAIATRVRALQALATQRSREIEATREKALGRIVTIMQPLVAAVYKAHGCGLMIDRNSVLGGNMSNDLTPVVVKALDAQTTTISFDRETLKP